jgi:hypothetical protein
MAFGDIITNLELIRSVDIGRVSALIFSTNMSREPARLMKLYEYNIQRMAMEMNVAAENARAANDMADRYQRDTALIIGSFGEMIDVAQPSGTYDSFLEQALSHTRRANTLREDIIFYQTRLTALGGPLVVDGLDMDLPEGTAFTTARATANDIRFVEQAIPGILANLSDWAEIINQTADDHLILEAFNNATRVVVPAHFTDVLPGQIRTMAIITGAVTFVGLFFGFLASIWKTAFPDERTLRRGQ